MHTGVVAAVAFVMGALAATVVLGIHGNVSEAPVIASANVSPNRVAAFEPKSVAPPRPLRDVLVEPNVDPSAFPKDRTHSVEAARPAIESPQQEDQAPSPEAAEEPWAVNLQQTLSAPNVAKRDVEAAAPASGGWP